MPPKAQSGGMQQQQQGGPQGPPMGYVGPQQQHDFHQYVPNVDNQGSMGPMPPHHNQQYPPQQQPPPSGGAGKRGGGGGQQHQQQQQQQQAYGGGGGPEYGQYGGNQAYYGGGNSNDYSAGPPQSGNSSANASATRRSTGPQGGNTNNNNNSGGYGNNPNPNPNNANAMHHHNHHFNSQQPPMGGMLPPPQGTHYGGGPLPPMSGNNNNNGGGGGGGGGGGYGMEQGPGFNNHQRGGPRDGGNRYGDTSGVASPLPAPGGMNYLGPPGPRRGGGPGAYGNNNNNNMPMNAPMGQQPPQPQQQRYSGGGGNNNNSNMYRSSPYPAPGTPHHPQSQPLPPPPQPGGNPGGVPGWGSPPMTGMMPPQQKPPSMGPQMSMGQGGGNYPNNNNYNNNGQPLPPPHQHAQPPPPHQMQHGGYHGPEVPPGGYPPGFDPMAHAGMGGGGVPYSGGGYGGNYGPAYDGPAPGMPSVVSPPPGAEGQGMLGGNAPPAMRGRNSRPPAPALAQPPMGGAGQFPHLGPGMVPSPAAAPTPLPMDSQTPMLMVQRDGPMAPVADMSDRQKDLYVFLRERRLLKKKRLCEFFPADYDAKQQGPLSIAVDGNYLLSTLRDRMCHNVDPLWFLHSSLPDCLTEMVNAEVQRMRQHNLEPVWVFQGVGISGDVEAFLPSYEELEKRDVVWQTLMEGSFPTQGDIADAFDTSTAIGEDVVMAVQRFLRSELNVLTVTAPFSHWCQMCTLHHEKDVQLLYGHPEMLMVPYGPMQLIVEIDFASDTVAFFDREEVLQDLFPAYVVDGDSSSASDRLLDLALLAATQPVVTAARASTQCTIDQIYEELSSRTPRYATLSDFITAKEDNQAESRQGSEALKHSKGRAYMRYNAVFSKQSKESPMTYFCRVLDPGLDARHTPVNLSGVFGNLLPLSLFFFQYSGLLSVSFMTIITQSYFRDELPVSDSLDYQECLPKLVALRGQIVYQIVLKLQNDAYQLRMSRLSWVRWFEKILLVVQRPLSTITLDEWRLEGPSETSAAANKEGNKGKSRGAHAEDANGPENVTVATVLNTSGTCIPPRDVAHREILYHGRNETMQAILLKSLDFLGYYSHKPHQPEEGMEVEDGVLYDPNGSPLPPGQDEGAEGSIDANDGNHFTQYLCLSLNVCDAEFQSALVRFTELLRIEVLNAAPSRYVPVPSEDSPDALEEVKNLEIDAAPVRLASRIACLVTVPYLEDGTGTATGDADHETMPLGDDRVFNWAPVYSRSLCAFSIMVRAMNRDLRELVEVITAALFLQGHSDCTLEEFTSFTPLLPFGDVPSAIGGLLLHYVLVFPDDYDDDDCTTIEARCEILRKRFGAIRDIATQLRRVMEFTFQALFLLNAYITHDDDQVRSDDLTGDLVDETLNILAHKWSLHLVDPVPRDVHGLWPREV